jgi:transcriptional regulator with XRE-family HTH domain
MDLADFLEFRRVLSLLSRQELAARCGLAPEEIARYETGQAVPPAGMIPSLARALHLGPRLLARIIQESQAGGISLASDLRIARGDRRRTVRLGRWALARNDTPPEQRAIWRKLRRPQRNRHRLRWYLNPRDQKA